MWKSPCPRAVPVPELHLHSPSRPFDHAGSPGHCQRLGLRLRVWHYRAVNYPDVILCSAMIPSERHAATSPSHYLSCKPPRTSQLQTTWPAVDGGDVRFCVSLGEPLLLGRPTRSASRSESPGMAFLPFGLCCPLRSPFPTCWSPPLRVSRLSAHSAPLSLGGHSTYVIDNYALTLVLLYRVVYS
jgi:hypothetical protein